MKRKMVQCATAVNRDAVRRTTVNGVEHVVVSSYTLPDDIVMNGGLYPAAEIANSYHTLERTLAPVEHPTDADGNYISAADPDAIHNFYAGAYNVNVRREDGRVHIEKWINVQEALKSDRGKRLMDRICELETNDKARPIHTSVGVFLGVEELDGPKTNAAGDEYTWVAREMVFDHDAILLDSVAAATPDKGVGMAVNGEGDKIPVDTIVIQANASLRDIEAQLDQAIRGTVGAEWMSMVDIVDDMVIFETNVGFFQVPYRVDEGTATIVGIPLRVERNVTYTPKTNSQEDDAMKELMINALREAGVEIADDISDTDLLTKYNELQASNSSAGGDTGAGDSVDLSAVVANALKPFSEKLDDLATKLEANDREEIKRLATVVGNSEKYPGIDADAAEKFGAEMLRKMAAHCGQAHGVPFTANMADDQGALIAAPSDMPE